MLKPGPFSSSSWDTMRMDCEFEFRTAGRNGHCFDHQASFVAASGAASRPAWKPGRPLRILLAGYIGAGNVGADMRSIETIRRSIFSARATSF